MAQTKYQVSLSVDGKYAVSVQSDDPAAVTEGLIWAQDLRKKLLRLGQASQATANGQLAEQLVKTPAYQQPDADSDAPICGVHDLQMVLMHGRNGDFWSCHEKNDDGSWCSYKPSR